MSRDDAEDPCRRCDQTSLLSTAGRERQIVEARTLPCACNGGCGAAFCGGEDVKVAG